MPLPSTDKQLKVFDPETSRLLAVGQECGEAGGGHHSFSCLHGNGTLLTYYFGKGKHDVVIRSGPNEGIRAHITTCWKQGKREWTFDW